MKAKSKESTESKELKKNKQDFEMCFVFCLCFFVINFCIGLVGFSLCDFEIRIQYDVCLQKKTAAAMDVWFVMANTLVEPSDTDKVVKQFDVLDHEIKEADQCRMISSLGVKPN